MGVSGGVQAHRHMSHMESWNDNIIMGDYEWSPLTTFRAGRTRNKSSSWKPIPKSVRCGGLQCGNWEMKKGVGYSQGTGKEPGHKYPEFLPLRLRLEVLQDQNGDTRGWIIRTPLTQGHHNPEHQREHTNGGTEEKNQQAWQKNENFSYCPVCGLWPSKGYTVLCVYVQPTLLEFIKVLAA